MKFEGVLTSIMVRERESESGDRTYGGSKEAPSQPIGGWEEGERRERNKQKRQPGRTGAGQRGEWHCPGVSRSDHSAVSSKARQNSLEPAEWSERLTPGQ